MVARAMTSTYRSAELPIHRAILHYLQLRFPNAVIHHSSQNIGVEGKAVARAVALAKSMGMQIGFPDLIVIYGGHIMGFEVKAEGGITSEAQRAVGALFMLNGGCWAVVRSIDDVVQYLKEWGVE